MSDNIHKHFQHQLTSDKNLAAVHIAAVLLEHWGVKGIEIQKTRVAPTRSQAHLYSDQGDIWMLDSKGVPCCMEVKQRSLVFEEIDNVWRVRTTSHYDVPTLWIDSPDALDKKMRRNLRKPVAYMMFDNGQCTVAVFFTSDHRKLFLEQEKNHARGHYYERLAIKVEDLSFYDVPRSVYDKGWENYKQGENK